MQTNKQLAGKTVIVTRPLAQAQNMCELLECQQATVVHFPVINISVIKDIEPAKNTLLHLNTYDIAIFISVNAVYYAMSLAQELHVSFKNIDLAAVGPATKAALKNYGYTTSITPSAGFTSEALLAHKSLQQVAGKKILIIRGLGGREQLRQTLQARDAQVDYVEVYQRELPKQRNNIDMSQLSIEDTAILIYSVESIQNLWSLCSSNEQQWLTNAVFILGSQRIAEAAVSNGFAKNPIIAENPSDAGMLDALIGWAEKSAQNNS